VKLDDALSLIRQIPDFPLPGILFHDITPLLGNSKAFKTIIEEMSEGEFGLDYVAGMEARGFIFASALSNHINIGFIPIRKMGKLPSDTYQENYGLEYGSDTLEIHKDSCAPDTKVLIVDDVLATGGTASAAIKLVEKTGATVSKLVFLLEIESLKGREKILSEFPEMNIRSLKMI
jgi:adenine phosphoribosyltransferase